jgi:hypothetical protein
MQLARSIGTYFCLWPGWARADFWSLLLYAFAISGGLHVT